MNATWRYSAVATIVGDERSLTFSTIDTFTPGARLMRFTEFER